MRCSTKLFFCLLLLFGLVLFIFGLTYRPVNLVTASRPTLTSDLCQPLDSQSKDTLPFAPGEILNYEIKWDPPRWLFILPATYNAGDITLRLEEKFNYNGSAAYRIRADAKSSGALPKVTGIKINDTFESILDAKDFCSQRIIKRIREGKRKRDVETVFYRSKGKLSFKEVDLSKNPPQESRREMDNVPACVHDILSAFYAARLKRMEPGDTYAMTISDDGKVKNVQIKVLKREPVKLPNKQDDPIDALKIQIFSVFGGLYKSSGDFYVWLSDDKKKIPLKFDAKVKHGRVYGFLKEKVPGTM